MSTTTSPPTTRPRESQWAIAGRQFRRNRPAVWGLRITTALVLLAVYAPLLACQVPLLWREPGGSLSSPWVERLFDEITWEHGVDRFFNVLLVTFTFYFLVRLVCWPFARFWGADGRARFVRFRNWFGAATLIFGLLMAVGWNVVTRSLPSADFTLDPEYLEKHAQRAIDWTDRTLAKTTAYPEAKQALASRDPKDLEDAKAALLAWTAERSVSEASDPLDAASTLGRSAEALREAVVQREREKTAGTKWYVLRTPVPYGYRDQREGREEQFVGAFERGSGHVLGTDLQGRDVLARIIYGTRISLTIGLVAVAIYVTIGTILGALAGYFGRKTDLVIMRLVEILICVPSLFLIMMIVALTESRSIFLIMVAIGLVGWTSVCRLVRGQFLKERAMDYVTAARAAGLPTHRIIFRHVLPNAFAPVLVAATFGVASAILVENTLAFIGLGDISVPSWGRTLDDGRVNNYLHLVIPPSVAIFLTVTALNLVGDGIRDALDPKLRN